MSAIFEINSIINSNSIASQVGDTIEPYTFIEFISRTSQNNSEETFLTSYKEYLTEWAKVKNANAEVIDTKTLIKNQIINLLKIITVSYTTFEEQLFIASLNWDYNNLSSPAEQKKARNAIYSALPIFVSRIKEIANFYKKQRTEAVFSIDRNKIKGTQLSIEKIIFDKIINFLFNNDPSKVVYVQNYINVSIDNFIDTYSDYFDVDTTKVLSCNYNQIDSSIYFELETVLKDMIFNGDVYLNEIPLIAQLNIDLSQHCVGDKLVLKNELEAESKLSLIDDTEKIALRKKLYQKYLGVDFYYLTKDSSGNILTDIFIKADNPTNNLLNQQEADTPFTESKQLKLLKNIGLFFKPDKTSILQVNTENFTYRYNTENIEVGKVYIFPDPSIYGNVAFNRRIDYPLIIEYSFNEYIKNFAYSWAKNDPYVSGDMQAFFPYYSKEQDIDKFNKNYQVSLNFNKLSNEGYIFKSKSDLFSNKFAIIKEKDGKFARDWNIEFFKPIDDPSEKFLEIDGGILGVDDLNWASQTSADNIAWTPFNHYYSFFIEGGISILLPQYYRAYIPDGAFRGNGNTSLDISTVFDQFGTALIDAGDFSTDYNNIPPYISDLIPKLNDIKQEYRSELENTMPPYEDSKQKSYYDIKNEIGKLYISVLGLIDVSPIENLFSWWKTSQNWSIIQFFINNAIDIELLEDILIIKAKDTDGSHHLMFEAFTFDAQNNTFKPKYLNKQPIFFTDKTVITQNSFESFNSKSFQSAYPVFFEGNKNKFNKASDIFYVERQHKAYFAIMQVKLEDKVINGNISQMPILFPQIYEVDLVTFDCKKYIFPINSEQRTESFKIPDSLYGTGYVSIEKLGTPCLTYSNDTNMFMLTYILYDLNLCPYVYKHYFRLSISGANLYGYIDEISLDSTLYSPAFSGQASVVSPGDSISLLLHFNTNIIVA